MPIKAYKLKYKKPLTAKDSTSFFYRDNDTLVLIENFIRPKGVSIPYEYKDSTFLYFYKKVAFNHKTDSIDRKTSMKYWKDDIRIFFSKSVSRKTKKKLLSFAKTITKPIDSLDINVVKKVENSNFIIYYFGDFEYEPRMVDNKNSDYYMYWNNKNQIYRNTIKLDSKIYFNEAMRINKLKEFVLQSLGHFKLRNDFSCNSYFANCHSANKQLTPLDLELLKYHYSYGICKGTDLETFENQHEKAKEQLKKNNSRINFFHTND
ncbi:hypothetical protein [Lacinutrix sp. Hel_I_90]|uniref:hypothetical protein n=1 Tax=Lacinutrix sp. Hel_I_90 TaxID=1249999 RepID=UPI000AE801EE|nr:hypothetical protein [Lacinutrix sp. Hel_I_90]